MILTGQHPALDDHFSGLGPLDIRPLAYRPSQLSAGELCEVLEVLIDAEFARAPPRLVLVQGDTASAMAGARAANLRRIAIGHVEAGLRSFDLNDPWPEEEYRREIDGMSSLLFAPTILAARNLEHEKASGRILVTGNSGIDALFAARDRRIGFPTQSGPPRLVVTCHRRENRRTRIDSIAAAIRDIASTMPVQIIFPLHPNPDVGRAFAERLDRLDNVNLVPPVDYNGMVGLISDCWAILTDSGGLQEEGAALGKPVLVMRDATERPEAHPNIAIVGHARDAIVPLVRRLLEEPALYERMSRPNRAFGDGTAGVQIADAVVDWLAVQPPRPALGGATIHA